LAFTIINAEVEASSCMIMYYAKERKSGNVHLKLG